MDATASCEGCAADPTAPPLGRADSARSPFVHNDRGARADATVVRRVVLEVAEMSPESPSSDPDPLRGGRPGTRPRSAAHRRLAPTALAVALAALVAGCASPPTMRSDVVRFHAWQAAEPLSFAIRAPEPSTGSLERRSYQQLVRDRLVSLGFVEADASSARYQVAMDVRVVPEPRRVTEYWPPVGPWPGPWIGPRYGYPWRYDPWWGIPPAPIAYDTTLFRHELRVDLFDVRVEPSPGRKVWESRAVAYANSESTPRLMPGLVAAAFADFPGESGTTRRVEVPLAAPPR